MPEDLHYRADSSELEQFGASIIHRLAANLIISFTAPSLMERLCANEEAMKLSELSWGSRGDIMVGAGTAIRELPDNVANLVQYSRRAARARILDRFGPDKAME